MCANCSTIFTVHTTKIILFFYSEASLANRAFKEAQNVDPSAPRGWTGQALLAESAGVDEEAMDLFRHTAFLGNEEESQTGYADWVCRYRVATSGWPNGYLYFEVASHW